MKPRSGNGRISQPGTGEETTTWLRARKKAVRRKAVGEYAARVAGTPFDLDPHLKTAAVEQLMRSDRESGMKRGVLDLTLFPARCAAPGQDGTYLNLI
jgi:hypothetical protein